MLPMPLRHLGARSRGSRRPAWLSGLAAACCAALLAGCAGTLGEHGGAGASAAAAREGADGTPAADRAVASLAHGDIAPFSGAVPGGPWPAPWSKTILAPTKKRTVYDLVQLEGRTVLRARANASASGLQKALDLDPRQRPMLEWSWRVLGLIPGADVRDRFAEDSPVRVILAFDGDKSTLPVKDRMLFERARLLTGRELPYATLMYVWENQAPVEAVIDNPHTDRVRKIVVASGADELGRWHQFRRDIVADYKRAFGGEPGRLIAVGVMTDTDNTGESAEAFYGDLRLLAR
jgi:hypothetical protein